MASAVDVVRSMGTNRKKTKDYERSRKKGESYVKNFGIKWVIIRMQIERIDTRLMETHGDQVS